MNQREDRKASLNGGAGVLGLPVKIVHHFHTSETHISTVDVLICTEEDWPLRPESSAPGWEVAHVSGSIIAARLIL